MEIKTLLFMTVSKLVEKKLIEGTDGPLTKEGNKLLNELSQICHDIMLNESDTFDGVPHGTDTRGIFDAYISILTGNDDVALLAFLYSERESGYTRLRETLKDTPKPKHKLANARYVIDDEIEDDKDNKESKVNNFTKKHTSH